MMTGPQARERSTVCIPPPIQPMLPTPAPPFHRPGWIYEEKYDGWRIIAYKRADTVRLLSRNGIDFTGRFRELAAAIALLPPSTLILDGEVAVFDEHLLSRRDLLRRPDPRAVVTPPIFITFDCAHAGGRDLRHYPLGARREVLEAVLAGQRLLLAARRNGTGREARTEQPATPCSSVWSRATACCWESSRGSHTQSQRSRPGVRTVPRDRRVPQANRGGRACLQSSRSKAPPPSSK